VTAGRAISHTAHESGPTPHRMGLVRDSWVRTRPRSGMPTAAPRCMAPESFATRACRLGHDAREGPQIGATAQRSRAGAFIAPATRSSAAAASAWPTRAGPQVAPSVGAQSIGGGGEAVGRPLLGRTLGRARRDAERRARPNPAALRPAWVPPRRGRRSARCPRPALVGRPMAASIIAIVMHLRRPPGGGRNGHRCGSAAAPDPRVPKPQRAGITGDPPWRTARCPPSWSAGRPDRSCLAHGPRPPPGAALQLHADGVDLRHGLVERGHRGPGHARWSRAFGNARRRSRTAGRESIDVAQPVGGAHHDPIRGTSFMRLLLRPAGSTSTRGVGCASACASTATGQGWRESRHLGGSSSWPG
jgi:hypothetical protein